MNNYLFVDRDCKYSEMTRVKLVIVASLYFRFIKQRQVF